LTHDAGSHDVEAAPGEELESQDALLKKRGGSVETPPFAIDM
jgi:hypothetical protein